MFGFGKEAPYDREATLRRAEEFRSRKNPKKAIAELRKVLAVDPTDATAHAKLGPLLVSAGQPTEALESFRISAENLDARGFSDKALSLWLQIAQTKVSDLPAWERVTQFYVERGRKPDGVKVLLLAANAQAGREGRPRAVHLLEQALRFEPQHLEAILVLAPLLVKEKRANDARRLLEGALTFTSGVVTRRVRKKLFVLFPGFRTLWHWLRA
jgi:cytochrome c-type biogenesis protein CcmH/NrfG